MTKNESNDNGYGLGCYFFGAAEGLAVDRKDEEEGFHDVFLLGILLLEEEEGTVEDGRVVGDLVGFLVGFRVVGEVEGVKEKEGCWEGWRVGFKVFKEMVVGLVDLSCKMALEVGVKEEGLEEEVAEGLREGFFEKGEEEVGLAVEVGLELEGVLREGFLEGEEEVGRAEGREVGVGLWVTEKVGREEGERVRVSEGEQVGALEGAEGWEVSGKVGFWVGGGRGILVGLVGLAEEGEAVGLAEDGQVVRSMAVRLPKRPSVL